MNETMLEHLQSLLRGKLLVPGREGYEAARKVWNGMYDRRPLAIAQCAGAADVRTAVLFAREHGLPVAVRGGGHSLAGHSICDHGLVIDLTAMKGIRVDSSARLVQAQPGLRWSDFDRETAAFGLATTGGVISTTGIAGLTLGGGIGWLAGRFGLTCDNLTAVDLVRADGQLVKASGKENEDLFWALRGGGGNFGIVTQFEYQLHPVSIVVGCILLHPFARARDVLRIYREASARAPDELTMYAALMTGPEGSAMCAIVPCHSGSIASAEQALKPVRSFGPPIVDTVAAAPYTQIQTMMDHTAPYGIRSYQKCYFLREISDQAITTLIACAETKPTPQSVIILEHVHGAATRIPPEETAFGLRGEHYSLNVVAMWTDAADDESCTHWARESGKAVEGFGDATVYVNYLGDEGQVRIRAAYGDNYLRLAELKRK
jgi:FAD binding domain